MAISPFPLKPEHLLYYIVQPNTLLLLI